VSEKSTATTLKAANEKLRAGDYQQARASYALVMSTNPELAHIVRLNLEIIDRLEKSSRGEPTNSERGATSRGRAADDLDILSEPEKPGEIYLKDLYEAVGLKWEVPIFRQDSSQLVSVIVTAHNTEAYVESCIESLLSQSYPNIEIIVVDDASTDNTAAIVKRISLAHSGVRLIRLNANLGTYYAKNVGVIRSKGHIIFFQDSDDTSHPHRIALQVKALTDKPSAQVVRGAYSRVDPLNERIISVNGLTSKLGLITLGVRREVFKEIGYFNCTTKASDDEFFNRVVKFLGRGAIVNIDAPLYYNTMRDGSLFADMVQWKPDGSIQQIASPVRKAYVEEFSRIHGQLDQESVRGHFAFPRIRDAIPVHPEMTKLSNPKIPVIVSVCSIPERIAKLERTLRSVAPQCDKINVYLDRYPEVPEYLKKLGVEVVVRRSQDLPGLRDNGKFIELENLAERGEEAYYFTIDDDIEYPPDYVNSMIAHLKTFDEKVVVGVHGAILRDQPKGYFSDRRIVYSFTKALLANNIVNVLGTGTTAFRASLFPDFRLDKLVYPGMVDLYLAVECAQRKIPQVCVSRPEGWLIDLGVKGEASLYTEFAGEDSRQAEVIKSVEMWGYAKIVDIIQNRKMSDILFAKKLLKAVPVLRSITRVT
jgi:glycosyltransferase involved in cell wall biosynthesis